jgi:hypothetical protein
MPDFSGLIRGLVKNVAKPLTESVRVPDILWTPMIGRDQYGPKHATKPTKVSAMVESTSETVATENGTLRLSSMKFTFFDPINIREGDWLTLNDRKMTVIKVGGLLDPDGKPYLPEAWTGR